MSHHKLDTCHKKQKPQLDGYPWSDPQRYYSARTEMEAVDRKQRDYDWKQSNDNQCEMNQIEKERMKGVQKKEDAYFQGKWDEDNRMDREKQLMAKYKDIEEGDKERRESNMQIEEIKNQMDEDEKIITETCRMYAKHGMEVEKYEQERRRQRDDTYSAALKQQIQYHERMRQEHHKQEEEECAYNKERFNQREQLQKYKEYTDLQVNKHYQQDLLGQIAYNKLSKERQKQQERDEFGAAKQVDKELYVTTMAEMAGRPDCSDLVHPSQKIMMNKGCSKTCSCLCKKPDWCKD